MNLYRPLKVIFSLALILLVTACSGRVPSSETATATLKQIIPLEFKVEKIQALKGIPGLCEVIVIANNQPMVFYLDKKGKYVLSGNLIDAATKKNLTIDILQQYQQSSK